MPYQFKSYQVEEKRVALCRVGEIVRILRTAAPQAHVLLQAVLPRGAAWIGLTQWKWPNRFAKPIWALNAKFQVGADSLRDFRQNLRKSLEK
jgi:hypothetical protein